MKALYPGTFDPITLGHLSIINKAARLFSQLVVGVSTSRQDTMLSAAERLTLAKEACRDLANVSCETYSGLTVYFAQKINAGVIVRGMRSVIDLEREKVMSRVNAQIIPQITTVLLLTDQLDHISSTLVREVVRETGKLTTEVKDMVPPCVNSYLKKKY